MVYLSIIVVILGCTGFAITRIIFPEISLARLGMIAFACTLITEIVLVTIVHLAAERLPEGSKPFSGNASDVIVKPDREK